MEDRLHNLMIIIGPKGIGKKYYLREYCKQNGLDYISFGNKINDIRELINFTHNTSKECLVVIENGDNLSIQAQNCLLKTSENPPKGIHIAICTSNTKYLLETTFSRATFKYFVPFPSKTDLQLYAKEKLNLSSKGFDIGKVVNACSTYGDLEFWSTKSQQVFDDYRRLSGAMVKYLLYEPKKLILGISKLFSFSEDEDGYDPLMFLKIFISDLMFNTISVGSRNARQLLKESIISCSSTISYLYDENKRAVFEMFILKLKNIGEKYGTK